MKSFSMLSIFALAFLVSIDRWIEVISGNISGAA